MSRAHSAVGKSPPGSHGQGEEAGNTGHRLACPRLGLTICTRAWRPASWPGRREAAALPACRPACGQAEGWSFAQGLHAWVLTLGVTRSPRGQPLCGCACVLVCYGYSTSMVLCRGEAVHAEVSPTISGGVYRHGHGMAMLICRLMTAHVHPSLHLSRACKMMPCVHVRL